MKKIINEYHSFLRERFKGDKVVLVIELLYVLLCIGSGIYFATQGKVQNTVMAFIFPLIVFACCLVEWKLKVRGGALFYLVFFLMCTSNIFGNGYGVYTSFPKFDKVMHTLSGVVFTCVGFMFTKMLLKGDVGKNFAACLIAGLLFAMSVAAIWEIYEYFVTAVLHDDMQVNYTVYTIDYIKEISQTIIYYTDGTSEIVEGYIDVGLFDTLQDMTVCLIGGAVTVVLLIVDKLCFKCAVKRQLIPQVLAIDENATLKKTNEVVVAAN